MRTTHPKIITGDDGKEYDAITYTAVQFAEDKQWTVLGPWERIPDKPDIYRGGNGVYRPHVAYCNDGEIAKKIAKLLTAPL